jgi:hypothetical protein
MSASCFATDRQRQSPEGNASQRLIPLLAEAPTPAEIDGALVAQCESMLDAIHLCIYLSRLPNEVICKRLGIDKGHWSRMLQSQAHFPPNQLIPLMNLCGNYVPLQWLSMSCGFLLKLDDKQAEIEALRARLAKLERAA